MRISAYAPVAKLDLGNVVFSGSPEKIVVNFFHSKVDAASPIVAASLKELEQTMGNDNIQINSYDFFSEDGKHKAQLLKVSKVPTVVINETISLENPTKNQIFDRVNETLTPSITSSRSDFMVEPSHKLVSEALAAKTK